MALDPVLKTSSVIPTDLVYQNPIPADPQQKLRVELARRTSFEYHRAIMGATMEQLEEMYKVLNMIYPNR